MHVWAEGKAKGYEQLVSRQLIKKTRATFPQKNDDESSKLRSESYSRTLPTRPWNYKNIKLCIFNNFKSNLSVLVIGGFIAVGCHDTDQIANSAAQALWNHTKQNNYKIFKLSRNLTLNSSFGMIEKQKKHKGKISTRLWHKTWHWSDSTKKWACQKSGKLKHAEANNRKKGGGEKFKQGDFRTCHLEEIAHTLGGIGVRHVRGGRWGQRSFPTTPCK